MTTCWERAGPLALVCDVCFDFVTFPFGILGQPWYLIVSIPDPCCLSSFKSDKCIIVGHKYCRMLHLEHSAILLTFI